MLGVDYIICKKCTSVTLKRLYGYKANGEQYKICIHCRHNNRASMLKLCSHNIKTKDCDTCRLPVQCVHNISWGKCRRCYGDNECRHKIERRLCNEEECRQV